MHQGRFAGTGRPHDRYEFTVLYAERDAFERLERGIAGALALRDVFYFDHILEIAGKKSHFQVPILAECACCYRPRLAAAVVRELKMTFLSRYADHRPPRKTAPPAAPPPPPPNPPRVVAALAALAVLLPLAREIICSPCVNPERISVFVLSVIPIVTGICTGVCEVVTPVVWVVESAGLNAST